MAEHYCADCKCIVHNSTCPHCGEGATLVESMTGDGA